MADHLRTVSAACFNPRGIPDDQLPVIYGFNNGGPYGFMHACLIAEDGTPLGSHLCTSEGFMPGDLGILEGFRPDRHEHFRAHYPDGYRMEFVPHDRVKGHAKLTAALAIMEVAAPPEEESPNV